ncbi:UNVERIFIED_CONTAM: hypothetical protein Slati_0481800 [Sesamum latifolium]|uniref:DDE Tnp4 domain-containing protein n=1 Tax=Sesamum latifolium TaxID=2727402 RepID=A0AAW2Y0I1_9LAMI
MPLSVIDVIALLAGFQISFGLKDTNNVTVSEQVVIFLSILAHHKKDWVVKYDFIRLGHAISKCFHKVLMAILQFNRTFLVRSTPITDDCMDSLWRWFKGCLGALDGTYIDFRVLEHDKARYRTQKVHITVNVLGVYNWNMQFIYILTGWEGSAADSRVLRDAINKPTVYVFQQNCLLGNYYLCDNGYTNGDGFLLRTVGLGRSFIQVYALQVWPYFQAWREKFGKDQANGEEAEDDEVTAHAATEELQRKTENDYVPTADWNPDIGFASTHEDTPPTPNPTVDPTVGSTNGPNKGSSSAKKRKINDSNADERLVDMVSTFCKDANARIGSLTKVLEREFENEENQAMVEDVVAEVDGLDENEQLMIVQRLHNNPKDLHLFFKLPNHKRSHLVRLMLDHRF